MMLRLPKSNLEWEFQAHNSRDYALYAARLARLGATFTMPDGERLHVNEQFPSELLDDPNFCDHIVRRVCDEMGREVGRRLVMG